MNDSSSTFLGLAVLVSALGGIAGCSSTATPAATPPAVSEEIPMPMNMNRQIQVARADLSERLGVEPGQVILSGAQPVTWRSGALGCPEPGMMYTQALVPGAVIYLKVDETMHAYHARVASEPFYCPRERVEPPVAEGDDLT